MSIHIGREVQPPTQDRTCRTADLFDCEKVRGFSCWRNSRYSTVYAVVLGHHPRSRVVLYCRQVDDVIEILEGLDSSWGDFSDVRWTQDATALHRVKF